MVSPRSEIDVKAGVSHLVPVPVIRHIRQRVNEAPHFSADFLPWCLNKSLSTTAAEINHYEAPLVVVRPAPGHDVLRTLVIRPARARAEKPFAVTKERIVNAVKKSFIEGAELFIGLLSRSPA